MIGIIKKLRNRKNSIKTMEESKNKLHEQLRQVCDELEKTNLWFQAEVDNNLIDACIHQRKVLNAKYRYIMSKIKLS